MDKEEKIVTGEYKDGSSLVIKKENLVLWKGLKFNNGNIKWLKVEYVGEFSCGLAPIDLGTAFGYVNRMGVFQIQPHYMNGEEFINNVAMVSDIGCTYVLDVNGNVIKIFDKLYNTNPFHQGHALVHEISDDGEFKRDALINEFGEFVIEPGEERKIRSPYDINNPNDFYSDGLLRFREGQKFGFKDINGEIIIYPKYANAYSFSEGLSAVKKGDKSGFIDTTGEEFIPCEFDSVDSFSSGIAAVRLGDFWGCIDKMSEIVIPFEFECLGLLSNGEIEFVRDGKWGIMDKKMNVIVQAKYDSIEHFRDGIATFSLDNKLGVIDRFGNELISDLMIGCHYTHKYN